MGVAVFLIGFGQPNSLDEVGAFVEKVIGRKPSPEAINGAVARYKLIGGLSPLVRITREQAAALEKSLQQSGVSARVYVGMRHNAPSISDALEQAKSQSPDRKAVVITLAAQYSAMSAGEYIKLFNDANNGVFDAKIVKSYGKHPLFIEAIKVKIDELLAKHPNLAKNAHFIFSAHSLPAKILNTSDTYVEELKYCMNEIVRDKSLAYSRISFQSKGGGPFEWLGPSLEETIEAIHGEGGKSVVVVPVGFVSDHIETLYDIDILAANKAKELGVEFHRTESLNTSPQFVELLASLVRENLS